MFKNCKKIMTASEMENRQNWLNVRAQGIGGSDEDCMEELVYRTMQENHIKDPAHLQPGQLIVIHVKPVKGGGKA